MSKKKESRCTGHCCRSFGIPYSPQELQRMAAEPSDGSPRRADDVKIAAMVIYLGQFPANPVFRIRGESWAVKGLRQATLDTRNSDQLRMESETIHSPGSRDLHFYACRHVQLNGDCGIYEERPEMCRSYPNGHTCDFAECTWDKEDQDKANQKRHLQMYPQRSRLVGDLSPLKEKVLCSAVTPFRVKGAKAGQSSSLTPKRGSSRRSRTGETTPTSGLTQASNSERSSRG